MKMFKHRNILGCIYALLLALPLCSILGRVLYVQWNKNAKDSYSQNNEYETIDDVDELRRYLQKDIYINSANNYIPSTTSYQITLNYSFIEIVESNIPISANIETSDRLQLTLPGNPSLNSCNYAFFNGNTTLFTTTQSSNSFLIKVYLTSFTPINVVDDFLAHNHALLYKSNENTLDNAFSYSVNQLIQDNNFGEINFVGLFDDLFLDSTNSVNAMYLNFVNWYFNYTLFISVVYILYLVLMWFINFIRRLLEQGMDFGSRGY